MPELISEEQPRIKFECHRVGTFCLNAGHCTVDLLLLTQLMQQMEALGAAPILNDGLVGGNCAIRRSLADTQVPACSNCAHFRCTPVPWSRRACSHAECAQACALCM